MALQTINTGTTANDGTGDNLRAFATKCAENFLALDNRVSVKDPQFGALGDGVTDDSAAILAAFDAIRATGGVVDFPNVGGEEYLVSYGFLVPSNCVVRLNGCKITATTAWGQGTIPANATTRSQFHVAGSLTSGATLTDDVKNVAIIGDNAIIDMRYDEQTGTPPGACGISLETTPAPIVGNLWRVHDVLVKDVLIDSAMWYGTSVDGAKNVVFDNVRATHSANLGHVVVCGWNIHYEKCHGHYSQERSANQGNGFWNEANETWQLLRNISYRECRAEYNAKSGFRYYNDGQDVEVSIFAEGNVSRYNQWDGATQVSSPGDSGHIVQKTGDGTADLLVVLNNCIAQEEYNSGFKISRTATCTGRQRIILNNPVAINCQKSNLDSYPRAPINVTGESSDAQVYINNPVIVAPSANTLGYGIGLEYSENVFIVNPRFFGTFTYKLITGTLSGVARKDAGWDPGWDDGTGHIGSGTPFYRPVRLASWDQTAEPTAGTDTFSNELAVWQDDNNQFHGIYTRDDSSTPKYLDFRAKKRLRATAAYAGATISSGAPASGTVTVTGAALGDIVQLSYDEDLQANGSGPHLQGNVTAANTVRWIIANSHSTARAVPAGNIIINVIGSGY